jgi:hypothetical protein
MAKSVVVIAEIDTTANEVVLRGSQPDLRSGKTFAVAAGDTLEWHLRVVKGDLAGRRPRLRFVEFPDRADEKPLLENQGNLLEAKADVGAGGHAIRGTVSSGAHDGDYKYEVELLGPERKDVLTCFWASSPGTPRQSVSPPMGGGEKRGGP